MPDTADPKAAAKASRDRNERLAKALRDNLRRRKGGAALSGERQTPIADGRSGEKAD